MNKVSNWLEDRRRSYTTICEPQRASEAKEYAELVERLVVTAQQAAVAIRNSNADDCAADRLEEALAAIQGGEVGNE